MFRPFPMTNLIGQILRQFTVPLSKKIVKSVGKNPFLREHFLGNLGRVYLRCEKKLLKYFRDDEELEKEPTPSAKENSVRAMELGTQLFLELVIFILLCGVLVYETNRSSEKSRLAEARKARDFEELIERKEELSRRAKERALILQELREKVSGISKALGDP